MRISPLSGCSAPERILMSVLLPEPLSPTMAATSPDRTEKSTPRSASIWPKDLQIPTASTSVVPAAGRRFDTIAFPPDTKKIMAGDTNSRPDAPFARR